MKTTSHKPHLFVTPRRETTTLNWNSEPEREFHLYADAFRNAAQKLLENGRLDSGFGLDDFDACPVVFLYRHALELLLKEILLGDGCYFLKSDSRPDPRSVVENHSLTRFLPQVGEIFSELGWAKSFGEIEPVIKELAAVDPGSHSFRYPIKKDFTKSLSGPFRFSVREFAGVMENVIRILSEACYALPEEYQARAEEADEARIEELRYTDHYEPDEGYWEG
jgi:hypothetical protein